MTQNVEVIEGTVDGVNDRGVRVNGQWYNVSKWRAVVLPVVGTRVQLGVDSKGFIVDVIPLDSVSKTTADPDRRLAVLSIAANFLGQLARTRDDVRSDHVLLLADKWVAWLDET